MTQVLELPTLTTARQTVLPALRSAADRLSPEIRHIVGYHQGWLDHRGADTDAGAGKALRPALALLGAKAGPSPERGIAAAVAVELIHDFSLLHDDVMDGDTERRHRPAAWTVFGTSAAILGGDALLALALEVLLEAESEAGPAAARELAVTVRHLIDGQSSDLDFEQRRDVSPIEYLVMAGGKTAALLSAAPALGALLAGATEKAVAALADFGAHLGLAFQLVDDILGIWGKRDVLGKPVLADLRARKKSAPVVAALQAGGTAGRRLAELYYSPASLADDDLLVVAGLIEAAGGRRWATREAARQLACAIDALDEASLPADVRAELLATARFVTERNR